MQSNGNQSKRGRWQVERERCRIEQAQPLPPEPPEAPLSTLLGGVVRRLKLESAGWMDELVDAWPELVGTPICRHARPGHMDRDILYVFVDGSVWLSELQRFGRASILRRIRERFGPNRVRTVNFQVDPDFRTPDDRTISR
ncbi:MAG: hypothetical protein A2498_04640 [Lentisphaerae bacterium RIFOXYC12_FULL_60_16]|nr:MAG: hypothetical protein A2498_04640 [Lentisphaerae bacterium RIFOXYC12_FULL_60_16]OGV75615.1 MAG: hypothetical protein A2340_02240 [Lentisphaerae bacterium RIFOXYB12_FULL_60_10]